MSIQRLTSTYKHSSDWKIEIDFYGTEDPTPRPVLLFLHGGALIQGTRRFLMNTHIEMFASAGYLVASADYRLAPQVQLPDIIEDLQDLLNWLQDPDHIPFASDMTRFAVAGVSAGGYLALVCGTLDPRPSAIICISGYCDLTADWFVKPTPGFLGQEEVTRAEAKATVSGGVCTNSGWQRMPYYVYCRQQGLLAQMTAGCDPVRDLARLEYYSPHLRIDPETPPTIFLHGEDDSDAVQAESRLMYESLKKGNIPTEYLSVPDVGHFLFWELAHPGVTPAVENIILFLTKHVSSRSQS
jgi:acetyl esterase/lipase